jgi:hypothetical protein
MTEGQDLFEWLGLSGILAMIGGSVAAGRLGQRVANLEAEAKDRKEDGEQLARLDERTKAMKADLEAIKAAVLK